MSTKIPCPSCLGFKVKLFPPEETCPKCIGSGVNKWGPCLTCKGTGRIPRIPTPCTTCHGKGYLLF